MSRFRTEYKELSEEKKGMIERIKMLAEELEQTMTEGGTQTSRELSKALTELEDSVMWAVKHHTA